MNKSEGIERPAGLHPKARDLTGQVFGRLSVLSYAGSRNRKTLWICRCECGRERIVIGANLTRGLSRTCGRCRSLDVRSAEYWAWSGMRSRCLNPTHHAYRDYGGRGITVDPRWDRFENFLADMGSRPAGTSLDRKDNSLGYSPENCRWATPLEQGNNMRSNRLLTIGGRTQTVAQWARERGINYDTFRTRIFVLGWTPEEALTA